MILINLFREPVALITIDGERIELPGQEGGQASCNVGTLEADMIERVPLYHRVVNDILHVPDPAPDTMYVAPAEVAEALRRKDVVGLTFLDRDAGAYRGLQSYVV